MKIDVDLIKSYIKDYPIEGVLYNYKNSYDILCSLMIGDELLWEGHESGDWIVDKEATDTLTGRRHKECNRCGKLLESEIYASDTYNEKYFTFYAASGGLSIEAKEGVTLVGEIAIPSTYKDKPVTLIEPDAFKNCTDITKITIPKSIVSIGDRAFQGCSNLASVEFAKGSQLTDIGVEAFRSCFSLESVVIPDSVTFIGDNAFYGCGDLTTLVIGDNVETIGERAFAWCWDLQKVVIPDSVTSIGYGVFAYCDEDLVIYCEAASQPEGWDSRWNVDNRSVIWDWNCLSGHKWSDWALDETTWTWHRECEVCGEKESTSKLLSFDLLSDGTYSVRAGEDLSGDIVIPSTYKGKPVTTICSDAFRWCDSITSVVIPNSITDIGTKAFYNCKSLNSVVIGDNVNTIGERAFTGCSKLTSLVIPDSVDTIGSYAFYCCDKLTSAIIGDGVTTIEDYAFAYCSSLNSVEIGDSVTTIGERAFYHCVKLTSVAIPNGVTIIGYEVFAYCYILNSVEIGDNVTSIGERAFYHCESLTSVEIPNSVTTIGAEAFAYNTRLTSIAIPDSVTSIENNAFYHCESLTSVEIPNSVTSISEFVFAYCYKLSSVEIPNGVTSIGQRAFYWCATLTTIVIPNSVTSIGYEVFAYCSKLTVQLVEGNTAYDVKNGCLIEKQTKKIIFANAEAYIPSGTSAIGKGAFSGGYAAPIKIPLSVTAIEPSAFVECQGLILLVEATSEPDGWLDGWCDSSVIVVWGYTEDGDHSYGAWTTVVQPTCTRPGTMHRTCRTCGDVQMGSIQPLPHTAGSWIIDIEPTYESEGSKHKECTVCGRVVETVSIPKLSDETSTYLVTESGEFLTDEQGNILMIEGDYKYAKN